MLNADEKSRKSIRAEAFGVSRCFKTAWVTVRITCSVFVWSVRKLQRVLKRLGSRKQSFQHNALHTFQGDRCQGNGTIVVEGRRGGFLGDRDNI